MPATALRVGRPRRALKPGEDAVATALKRLKSSQRYYTDDPKVRWGRAALQRARARALAAAVVCTITLQDILNAAGETCPALGIQLSYARGREVIRADSATVDRLRPDAGYVPGNIFVVSAKANSAKGRCSPEELMSVGRWSAKALSEQIAAATTQGA